MNQKMDGLVSQIALIGSWITIFLLLKEKHNNNKPYFYILFELVILNLTCIVLKNECNVLLY